MQFKLPAPRDPPPPSAPPSSPPPSPPTLHYAILRWKVFSFASLVYTCFNKHPTSFLNLLLTGMKTKVHQCGIKTANHKHMYLHRNHLICFQDMYKPIFTHKCIRFRKESVLKSGKHTNISRLQHWHASGGGDSSVVRALDSWLKGCGFESLLERRENFLLQGRLSVLTLTSVSVPPPCYHSSM